MSFILGCLLALSTMLSAQAAGSREIGGLATWYDDGPGLYAAAGPDLRHGDWRGSFVEVGYDFHYIDTKGREQVDHRTVTVQLTDWCACGDRNGGRPTLLDLSATAFRRLAPLSKGVIAVEVTSGSVTLPATDMEE